VKRNEEKLPWSSKRSSEENYNWNQLLWCPQCPVSALSEKLEEEMTCLLLHMRSLKCSIWRNEMWEMKKLLNIFGLKEEERLMPFGWERGRGMQRSLSHWNGLKRKLKPLPDAIILNGEKAYILYLKWPSLWPLQWEEADYWRKGLLSIPKWRESRSASECMAVPVSVFSPTNLLSFLGLRRRET